MKTCSRLFAAAACLLVSGAVLAAGGFVPQPSAANIAIAEGSLEFSSQGIMYRVLGGHRSDTLALTIKVDNRGDALFHLRTIDLWVVTAQGVILAGPLMRHDGLNVDAALIEAGQQGNVDLMFDLGPVRQLDEFTLHWGARLGEESRTGEVPFAADGTRYLRSAAATAAAAGDDAGDDQADGADETGEGLAKPSITALVYGRPYVADPQPYEYDGEGDVIVYWGYPYAYPYGYSHYPYLGLSLGYYGYYGDYGYGGHGGHHGSGGVGRSGREVKDRVVLGQTGGGGSTPPPRLSRTTPSRRQGARLQGGGGGRSSGGSGARRAAPRSGAAGARSRSSSSRGSRRR